MNHLDTCVNFYDHPTEEELLPLFFNDYRFIIQAFPGLQRSSAFNKTVKQTTRAWLQLAYVRRTPPRPHNGVSAFESTRKTLMESTTPEIEGSANLKTAHRSRGFVGENNPSCEKMVV